MPDWEEGSGYRWRPLRVGGPGEGFAELSGEETGIRFVNELSVDGLARNEILANGSGVALGDVDGDGRLDIYLARLEGPNALYRNLGDWEFEEEAEERGVTMPGRYSTGVALADVDGDGDLDLLVGVLGGRNALLLNDGSGRFEEVGEAWGLEGEHGTTTLALADVDGDGDLDLYVTNYKARWARDLFSPEALKFENVVRRVDGEYEVAPKFREHFRILEEEGALKRWEFGEPDELYLNEGGGGFRRVEWTGGRFLGPDGEALARAPDEWGLSARFQDVDGDGDADLYVCNDLESPDRFWLNEGDGRFRLAGPRALRTTSGSSMTMDYADVDRDGVVDLFVADMLSANPARRRRQVPAIRLEASKPGEVETVVQANRNTLQVGRGDGTWADVGRYAGVAASEWTWGSVFLDVDLDGWEDLLVVNGHALDVLDADAQERVRPILHSEKWRRARLGFPPLRVRNLAFRNLGGLQFEEVGERWGFGREADISHGIAVGDLDGDGDADVIVNRLGSEALVLRNEAGAPRVAVRLRGTGLNTRGVGARVQLLGGAVPVQQKEVTAGGLYLSSSAPEVVFAAGVAAEMALAVTWPGGARTVVRGVQPNRTYEIERPRVGLAEPESGSNQPPQPPHFVDETGRLGHEHMETPFDDFARQPLLPLRLSQLGPGVAWQDVEGDGDPDLLIASGRGGRLALFRNVDGRLVRARTPLPWAEYDQTTVLGLPAADGSATLLVGRMNYEAITPEAARSIPGVVRVDLRTGETDPIVPGDAGSVGPMALADYDGDGDLDLFVGARVYPTAYPIPPDSRLYRNEGGAFELDGSNVEPLRAVGLVSAAVFSDIDGDADLDLLLALEWGPVKLLENRGGRFFDATGDWGLDAWTGRWNGLTTGDLDGDGRLDLVVSGWGWNTGYEASSQRPLLLYYGDLDRQGTLEAFVAQYEEAVGGVVPLLGFERLGRELPFVRRRIRSFTEYSTATVDELLGPAMESARMVEARHLGHVVFLNRGDRFEAAELPAEAQFAPAFYVGVVDLDGDGNEDVFLGQNFFATDPDTPRYDAGRSLWLRGRGDGTLVAVPGQSSGIEVYGETRGAAFSDYDGDGRVDLAVSQNGAPTRLFRNVGSRPGLRVRLAGTPGNPWGVGARLRVVYRDGSLGPVREVKAGSGYWSQDDPVQVLGLAGEPRSVQVTWPGGREREVSLEPGQREVTVRIGNGTRPSG